MELLQLKNVLVFAGLVSCVMASSLFSTSDFDLLSRLIRSNSDDDDNNDSLQTFNRPMGTMQAVANVNALQQANLLGRTFGQYGSYRTHPTWLNAVNADRRRHTMIHTNLRDTFPWLFKNLKTPSLTGFSLDGFWNSYAPAVPSG